MAKFYAFSTAFPNGIDMRKVPAQPELGVSATEASNYYVQRTVGNSEVFVIGSDLQFDIWADMPTSGTGRSYSYKFGGEYVYIINEMTYDWSKNPSVHGYIYQGQNLLGHQALIASFMEGNDRVDGTLKDDYLIGYHGNDYFRGYRGNDTFDGGPGIDTVNFGVYSSDSFVMSKTATGRKLEYKPFGPTESSSYDFAAATLSIERFVFSDKAVAYDLESNAGQALRFIATVAGEKALTNKETIGEIISYIDTYGIAEVSRIAVDVGLLSAFSGGTSNSAVISSMYKNITGALPSKGELEWTLNYMKDTGTTQAQALEFFVGLDATALKVGLVGLAQSGVEYVEYIG